MSECIYIALSRGSKSALEKNDKVPEKYEILVELPDELVVKDIDDLFGEKCKYKMGDGIHTYRELPYEDDLIPVVFRMCRKGL